MGAVAIGSFVAPPILNLIGPRPAFLVVGAILPFLVLVAHRRLSKIDSDVLPGPQLALIEGVAVFAPLSLVAKERIASHLVRVDVAAEVSVSAPVVCLVLPEKPEELLHPASAQARPRVMTKNGLNV